MEESLTLWRPRNAEEIALLKSLKLHKEDASRQWIGEFHPKTLRWSKVTLHWLRKLLCSDWKIRKMPQLSTGLFRDLLDPFFWGPDNVYRGVASTSLCRHLETSEKVNSQSEAKGVPQVTRNGMDGAGEKYHMGGLRIKCPGRWRVLPNKQLQAALQSPWTFLVLFPTVWVLTLIDSLRDIMDI